ncbi:CpaF family protein [Cellulomonas carbonis]|uniref:Pilus assembly protein CpaF n=1 Tax=Cellulomonas carbonis T26 TaxID=947969 RepID=A0A0A0BNI7_9CELL|nr:ATPase, T2SS/T4P/T4SS family [Cellulomonas carbonis]KGM09500.1 pilus assembly protein CpaF [Cellulomonas carbonis T26]GGB98805.1 pilus assembly protein CpaF [Cellulomonas carbonis]
MVASGTPGTTRAVGTAGARDAVVQLEHDVRELVRRRGIDPVRDVASLEALVGAVLADYDDRALRGDVPQLEDAGAARRALHDAVGGLGPLQQYLDDDEVEEIWINSPAQVFVARHGRPELTTTILTHDQVRELVERMLRVSGRRLDLSSPFVDASLPGGQRLHVAIPDVTRDSWAVNIRKYVVRATRVDDLVALGSLTPAAARFLHASVVAGLNVLVSGPTQAGKTTMLNALAGSVPPRDRVITCEEVFELQVPVRDVVSLQCRQPNLEGTGEITLRRLVKEALRMRPSRIVVGEVREAESLDMLIALNAGVPGMCTIHANSAREALTKLCTLPLLAGENVSAAFVVPTVASAVDLVVHLDVDADGRRRTREVVAVTGRVEAGVVETADVFRERDGRLVRADGFPPHPERYARAGIDVVAMLVGAHDHATAGA